MGLEKFIGPSREIFWKELSPELLKEFDGKTRVKDNVLIYPHECWEIYFYCRKVEYRMGAGTDLRCYYKMETTMRAPFVKKTGLEFQIFPEFMLSSVLKLFGLQDIIVGDKDFDDRFIVKGNNKEEIIELFGDKKMTDRFLKIKDFKLETSNVQKLMGKKLPKNVDELYFSCEGEIDDLDTIKNMFDIFSSTLSKLAEIASIERQDPLEC